MATARLGLKRSDEPGKPCRLGHAADHREWTPLARALVAAGDHWTLAIALELGCGRTRLGELQRRMPGISAGVLDRHLTHMVEFGLIRRERFREMPPRVEIELTEAGRGLLPIACALARWGMRHRWSEPVDDELVDVDALLRMLPGLLEDASGSGGAPVEAAVDDPGEPPQRSVRHVICDSDGRPQLERQAVTRAAGIPAGTDHSSSGEMATLIRGSQAAWVAALGPVRDTTQLQVDGDAAHARRLLAALPRGPG